MNLKLAEELRAKKNLDSVSGYWKARGYDTFPGWEKLPFADFLEHLSSKKGAGHKKMWLNPDGSFKEGRLSFECDSLIPLYDGIDETQKKIVSAGFFTYSALIVNLHIRLAFYSRKYQVDPNIPAVMAVASDADKADLSNRELALEVAAYIIYEGDGLGGYSNGVWKLWGRILNVPTPDRFDAPPSEVLSVQDAAEGNEEWYSASDEERKQLFYQWWCEINKTHAKVSPAIIGHIYVGYKLFTRYQQMESPNCKEEKKFDPTNTFDCQAALCGFYRRSAKGLSEAKAHDPNDLAVVPNHLALSLDEAEVKINGLLSGHNGLTVFGKSLIDLMQLSIRRINIVANIVNRQQEVGFEDKYIKKGYAVRLNKQGRTRRS